MGGKRIGKRRQRRKRVKILPLCADLPEGNAKNTAFYQWLMRQTDRDDLVGKLARDVRDDPNVARGDVWYDFWQAASFGGSDTPEAAAARIAAGEAWEESAHA